MLNVCSSYNFRLSYKQVLCNVQSSREEGTLTQLRNFINRRNVVTKVARDYHAVSDFVDLVGVCHVLDTAMKHLGMMPVDSSPSSLS